jgi:hypothetical protein
LGEVTAGGNPVEELNLGDELSLGDLIIRHAAAIGGHGNGRTCDDQRLPIAA